MLKTFIKKAIQYLPGKKIIYFESVPDLSDSTKAVFDEMLARGLDKKYNFIWLVSDCNNNFPAFRSTKYVDRKTLQNRTKLNLWLQQRTKCLISCNDFLQKVRDDQTSFYITHGTAIKRTAKGYVVPEGIDYVLTGSDRASEINAADMEGDINVFRGLGYPRNDELQTANRDLHECLEGDFEKVIVWYPTFRQHKNGKNITGASNALPILHDAQQAVKLNEIAKKYKTLIVMKPHFAQDLSYISGHDLENIRFIKDDFFPENKLSSYEFVGSCDALITDYSSIYYDFLLCDKHVAVVWEDIDEYRANPGFSVDVDYYLKGAEKIYNMEDFEAFIRHVATGEDPLKAERAEINALVNYASDGKNTERVVNFIVEKAKL